ncbi:hypothetical protein HPP92_019351 [Vanilla planifolia]|uniref:CDP-diacylglycerol--glycerol-3-phosphate 1-phosphatidyltransferase n=1 Tax=Vanilla planifolia TaxID=51239 RepID=A0A835UIU7_VANPL|nr:hypothetical protein HPP92_019351 [Vanilla planifolia]
MPSPLSTVAVLRAIALPSHLHHPFLYTRSKKYPSFFLFGSVRRTVDVGLRPNAAPNSSLTVVMPRSRVEGSGATRFAGESWRAGIRSDRACFAVGVGKSVEERVMEEDKKGAERGKDLGSVCYRYENEEAEVLMDDGFKHPLQQQQGIASRFLTIPTVLTLGRVAAVPLLVCTYHLTGPWAPTLTTSIFAVAAFTDWLDGHLARKMRQRTTFGAFLDPVADKLMVAATLVLLCAKPVDVVFIGEVDWLLTIPAISIIGREITMSAVREWAASQNSMVLEAVAVNSMGKWKTATQMTALTILLLNRDPRLTTWFLASTGVFLLYFSSVLALCSLAIYMRKIWRFLIK